MFFHFNLVAAWLHVDFSRLQPDGPQFIVLHPRNGLGIQIHTHFLLQVDDIRVGLVDRITFRLQVHHLTVAFEHLFEGVTRCDSTAVYTVFLTVIATRKGECPAGMFFFCKTEQIR